MNRSLIRWTCGIAAAAMIALLFVGGAQPGAAGLFTPPWDTVAHVGYFLVLTLLLFPIWPLPAWVVVLLAIAIGAADEWHQISLPGRDAAMADLLADAVGALLAAAVKGAVEDA